MIPDVFSTEKILQLKSAMGLVEPWGNDVFVACITGSNASGKSLLRRVIRYSLKQSSIEVIHLSQEGRATGGIARAFLYGAEDWESTGSITCNSLIGAFRTSRAKTKPHIILFDEPEIGLSEEAELGAAQFVRAELQDVPPHLSGVVLMTHSRHFVSVLRDVQGFKFLNLGDRLSVDEWVNRKIVPISPEEVREKSTLNFRRFTAILENGTRSGDALKKSQS
jgi:hypothetical protein